MKNQETELFSEWKNARPNKKFIRDGIVNENAYKGAPKKILFILKETNGNVNDENDLTKFLREGGRPETWDNIALWAYGIQNLPRHFTWEELDKNRNDVFRTEQLQNIGVLNLKKYFGTHTSITQEIKKSAQEDKEFIKKQIKIYSPDIIVCCGTPTGSAIREYGLVEPFKKSDWKISTNGIPFYVTENKICIINYCHPEARIDDNFKYYPLINCLRELLYTQNQMKPTVSKETKHALVAMMNYTLDSDNPEYMKYGFLYLNLEGLIGQIYHFQKKYKNATNREENQYFASYSSCFLLSTDYVYDLVNRDTEPLLGVFSMDSLSLVEAIPNFDMTKTYSIMGAITCNCDYFTFGTERIPDGGHFSTIIYRSARITYSRIQHLIDEYASSIIDED